MFEEEVEIKKFLKIKDDVKILWVEEEVEIKEKFLKVEDEVVEYVREGGEGSLRNLGQAGRECQDRERWKLFCHGHPLVGAPRSRHQNE